MDGQLVTCAGVTSGIDGALQVAALLRGTEAAQAIQLYMQYAPEPPFDSGNPETAPAGIVQSTRDGLQKMMVLRQAIVQRVAAKLGFETVEF